MQLKGCTLDAWDAFDWVTRRHWVQLDRQTLTWHTMVYLSFCPYWLLVWDGRNGAEFNRPTNSFVYCNTGDMFRSPMILVHWGGSTFWCSSGCFPHVRHDGSWLLVFLNFLLLFCRGCFFLFVCLYALFSFSSSASMFCECRSRRGLFAWCINHHCIVLHVPFCFSPSDQSHPKQSCFLSQLSPILNDLVFCLRSVPS